MPHAELARFLDHTLLRPESTAAEVLVLCEEAVRHSFHSVCVNGVFVERATKALAGSPVVVAATVGFPLGATAPRAKAAEARVAAEDGALELDVVAQLGALRAGDTSLVLEDLAGVVAAASPAGARVKVILETGLLTREQKEHGARLAREAGADMVKTSTGFGPGGATIEDVALLRSIVGDSLGVKAAGGIRTAARVRALLEAGATRIGSSSCVAIVQEE